MDMIERRRRLITLVCSVVVALAFTIFGIIRDRPDTTKRDTSTPTTTEQVTTSPAIDALGRLAIKGRAAKTGYARAQFGDGWADAGNCDVRNAILKRDLLEVQTKSATDCTVLSGTLHDPYTGETVAFVRGNTTSDDVQIDHVVALSDAWQKGAQQLTGEVRRQLANDPLNLLAVDGPANNQKSDSDAASWLPPNKPYRCRYVARQIAVKEKYQLWVTQAEHDAMRGVLEGCPGQLLPLVSDGA